MPKNYSHGIKKLVSMMDDARKVVFDLGRFEPAPTGPKHLSDPVDDATIVDAPGTPRVASEKLRLEVSPLRVAQPEKISHRTLPPSGIASHTALRCSNISVGLSPLL